MKKGAVLLLVLLLTLALTACGQTPPDDGSAAAPDRQEEPDAGYTAGGGEIVQIDGFREIDIQWIAGRVVVERYDGKVTELSETKLDGSPVSLKMEWRLNEDTGKLEIRSSMAICSSSVAPGCSWSICSISPRRSLSRPANAVASAAVMSWSWPTPPPLSNSDNAARVWSVLG